MKTLVAFVAAAAILGAVALAVLWERLPWNGAPEEEPVVCTLDAKICPDGSSVGRVPPDCEFAACPEAQTRQVKLYYYNPGRDMDAQGNIQCSSDGLVPVAREIPRTQTPIQDTVRLLLQGEVTPTEAAQGIETEYPLPGLTLVGAAVRDGVLTLEFSDPEFQTSGGSCRVGVLWQQIQVTALQFSEVREVRFVPEELFQP